VLLLHIYLGGELACPHDCGHQQMLTKKRHTVSREDRSNERTCSREGKHRGGRKGCNFEVAI
jgi:hypothetical protein